MAKSVGRRVWALGNACGLSGALLVILKTQVDGFFRYEANGVGGETQKCSLRLRLGIFSNSEKSGQIGWFGLGFWYFQGCEELWVSCG